MKILIFEDEPLAAEKIQRLISEVCPDCTILDVLESVEEAIDWLKSNDQPDLILSDIHLNDGLCFNIFSNVELTCPIIFTTAYEKYAIQAFEVNSIDYLLKPIQKDRLTQAINKLKENENRSSDKSVLFEEFKSILSASNRQYKTRFLCKIGNKIKSVPTDQIRYFYSQDKITFIIGQDGHRYPVNMTLDEADQVLDPSSFFRVNRKFIVHFEALDEISPYFKGRLKLQLNPKIDDDIVVSADKSPMFKSWLDR
jgi:DNA-binding LytR/AlgR family response regulator